MARRRKNTRSKFKITLVVGSALLVPAVSIVFFGDLLQLDIIPASSSSGSISSQISSSLSSSMSSSFSTDSSYISSTVLELPVFYATIAGLTGDELVVALNDLIDFHTTYPYTATGTDVWDILRDVDEDPNNTNNVLTLYSGKSIPKDYQDGGAFNSECANDCWNREHVWSKSHGDFGETQGPGTDIHHMHAEDESVNSTKNNLDFDDGGNIVSDLLFGGSRVDIDARYDSDSFEPPANRKGDVARMIMYMAVRYDGTEGYPDLQLVEAVLTDSLAVNSETGLTYGGVEGFGYYGRLSTLLAWNELDPPDEYEIARHEKIVGYQGNRNPFVDYYEFARLIWL